MIRKYHAVTSINEPLQLPADELQHVIYNPFNKVKQVSNNLGYMLSIEYGPDEQRIKSEYYIPSGNTSVLAKTKYFVGGDYEVEVLPNGIERRLHYLPGGGLYVSDKTNVGTMYFVLTDYQGSWNKVVTETGASVERYSFDPWGRRRHADNWNIYYVPTNYTFDRGYTGHEMLDAFGLINMNGRVYDPIVARFLSPDNYVQLPDNSQGFNRYSYCLNNPFVYTDPSGDFLQIPIIAIAAYIAMQGVISGDMARNSEMGFTGGFALGVATAALTMGIGQAIGPVMAGKGFWVGAVNMMVPAAVSGAATYGLSAAITGQPFDWKGYATSVGIAGLMGGIEGAYSQLQYNVDHPEDMRNIWGGGKIGNHRNQWSVLNWDKPDVSEYGNLTHVIEDPNGLNCVPSCVAGWDPSRRDQKTLTLLLMILLTVKMMALQLGIKMTHLLVKENLEQLG